MEIHCTSSEKIIISKNSSKIFEEIINSLNIEDKQYIISLYKRVKAVEKVNNNELEILYDFLLSEEFKKSYEEKIKTFNGKKEKLNNLEYENILSSFIKFMIKSKAIYILDLGTNKIDLEGKKYIKVNIGKKIKKHFKVKREKVDIYKNQEEYFEKFRNRKKMDTVDKYKYLELIDENENYLLGIDLKSGNYLAIEKISNQVVLKSESEIKFNNDINNSYTILESEDGSLYILLGEKNINIPKETIIHSIGNELYLIDTILNIIAKVGGEINSLGEGEIIKVYGNKIEFFMKNNNDDESKELKPIISIYNIRDNTFNIKDN